MTDDADAMISKAIESYLDTILVYSKDDYPDDYKDSIRELAILKKRLNNDEIWENLLDRHADLNYEIQNNKHK